MSVCCIGDTFIVPITIRNNGTKAATNVYVTTVVPAGVQIISGSVPRGTYSVGDKKWTVGTLNPGEELLANLTVEILDNTVNPYTFDHTIASDQSEATPLNNTDSNDFDLDAICADCDTPVPVDDDDQCTCGGNMKTNDVACGDGYQTIYEVDISSYINLNSVTYDQSIGSYRVVVIDPTKPWSFEYSIKCINLITTAVTTHGPATVSGSPTTANNLIKEKEIFSGLNSGDTVTSTLELPSDTDYIDVYRNGILMIEGVGADYTISGQDFTFSVTFGPSTGGASDETVIINVFR